VTIFWVKRYYNNSLSIGSNFLFCEICGLQREVRQLVFSPSSFIVVGSGIMGPPDPGWIKIGSGITSLIRNTESAYQFPNVSSLLMPF
jgi:hypothetical protein